MKAFLLRKAVIEMFYYPQSCLALTLTSCKITGNDLID